MNLTHVFYEQLMSLDDIAHYLNDGNIDAAKRELERLYKEVNQDYMTAATMAE